MQVSDVGPCGTATLPLQLVNVIGIVANTLLITWLAHRRLMADRRENGADHGPVRKGSRRTSENGEASRSDDGSRDTRP
jgi:hypothetical protein